jgi:sugar-specific transcriptional regulator TrmB/DNA-binding CsgD family transcriptional regulator
VLQALGLDGDEERAYRILIGVAEASADELSSTLGSTSEQAENVLRRLERRGLVTRSDGNGRFVAVSPALALNALLSVARDGMKEAEQTVAVLVEQYRAGAGARSVGDVVEIVTGVDAVRHRFMQIQHGAERELLVFGVAQPSVVHWSENTAEHVVTRRGVTVRVVIERSLLNEPGAIDRARGSLADGEEIRVSETLPIKLVIADRRVALVPLVADAAPGEQGALVVYRNGLLDGLLALFHAAWSTSVPLRITTDLQLDLADEVTALDQEILSLLLAGLTDEAVANHLGVSARTVQRRIRHLMNVAGAHTRLQLGWHASQRGWV